MHVPAKPPRRLREVLVVKLRAHGEVVSVSSPLFMRLADRPVLGGVGLPDHRAVLGVDDQVGIILQLEACARVPVRACISNVEELIQEALIVAPPEHTGPAVHPEVARLTRREREVARLIAHGLTSREIADALVISERTADVHADNIRAKLELHSRAEIAAWAAERGLRSGLSEHK